MFSLLRALRGIYISLCRISFGRKNPALIRQPWIITGKFSFFPFYLPTFDWQFEILKHDGFNRFVTSWDVPDTKQTPKIPGPYGSLREYSTAETPDLLLSNPDWVDWLIDWLRSQSNNQSKGFKIANQSRIGCLYRRWSPASDSPNQAYPGPRWLTGIRRVCM